ncbi:Cytochrome P450 monooxygenase [Lachnellula subtilissima]|uniref:Cytochrome P450 monooxygenase n=1 Tax=Lachnellula subtilissima TaxID=602034 RepID=A0A8H8U6J4_9HELO|nr:Cytochrome P450 monooxygenase [Lachnellula subtilissima]
MGIPIISPSATLLSAAGLVIVLAIFKFRNRRTLPYPPGPPGEFLIGHLRVIPFEDSPTAYLNWGREYKSDVLYFNTLRQPIIVLNSVKACVDLLDKRGANYADRPRFVLLELLGWGMTLTWLRWSPKMQQHRKMLQSPFAKSKVSVYQSLQMKETHRLVKGMMKSPLEWELELRRFAIAVVANVSYGVDINTVDHQWVDLSDAAGYATSHAGAPGGTIVDRFPPVRYLPDWLPGLRALKYAHDNKSAIVNMHEIPYQGALREMEEGVTNPSFIHNLLEKYRSNEKEGLPNDFTLADIKGSAAAIIIAGSETTMTTLVVFILMMMCNPEVQKKAQVEIDAAIGSDRLPEFEDIEGLTYLNYIRLENCTLVTTWNTPSKLERRRNVFAMHRDPDVYSNPYDFSPDRYIPKSEGGLGEAFPVGNFGFGRRVCPGQYLANNTVSMVMATMLSTLNIDWPVGPSGKPTPFEPGWSKIGQYHPLEFQCTMEPRSEKAKDLVYKSI